MLLFVTTVSFFFKGCIIAHCMYTPRFLYSFICRWTFRLFPYLDCCRWCWYQMECRPQGPDFHSFGQIWRTGLLIICYFCFSLFHWCQLCERVPMSPHSWHLSFFLDDSHSNQCEMIYYCVLICISVVISEIIKSLEKCLFKSIVHFKRFFLFSCRCFLYFWNY